MTSAGQHSIAVLGSGESGMGAVRLACKQGLKVFLSDASAIPSAIKAELDQLNVDYEEKQHSVERLKTYDEVVKSPGIPNTAPVIIELRKSGISVISEIEFASRFTKAKIVGITGSNGKTTTTLLTQHLLKSSGIDSMAAGNVGKSLSALLVTNDPEVIVLELSSFQLEDITDFKPDVAVLLNITPDHMDRYDHDMNKYADAKLRLVMNMDKAGMVVYNSDDQLISERVGRIGSRLVEVTTQNKTRNGAYLDEGHLIFDCEKAIQILGTEELPLVGRHNYYNQMVAVLVALEFDLSFGDILAGLNSFQNAAHRLEPVTEYQGVRYINDSKATNVDAVYYALDAMKAPVIWIAGGVNKGNDYDQIHDLVKDKVKALICLGKDNKHLLDAFGSVVDNIVEVQNAEESVRKAEEYAAAGDVVLLSPACASFDLFRNYEDRGDKFKAAVRSHIEELKQKEVRI